MFGTEKPWLKVYEGHVSPDSEIPEGSLYDLLRAAVEEHRERTALAFFGTEFSFSRLEALVEKMAASLAASGISKGDRVAIMLPNCPQYVISFFATVRLGAIVTQLNPMYVEREIEHIVTDSGAKTIIVYADVYRRVKNVTPETELENVIVVDFRNETEVDEGHYLFDEFVARDAEPAPEVGIDAADDVAVLQYTGGTTGRSKGAMLTHRNLIANVRQSLDMFIENPAEWANNEKIVGVLPFFHIYGLTCVMLFGLVQGLNQLLVPRFDVERLAALIRDERPTMFAGVPTMYMAFNASGLDLRKHRFHEVRVFNSGGAAIPVNLRHAFEQKTGRPVFEGYGLSEASPVTHNNPPFTGGSRDGSIGVPIPSTDARIADVEDGDKEMPAGESGELIISGPQVMKGYWNLPEETADTLRNGWLYTGDVAMMDEDGYFYIVDRKKDIIVASGYNVYPREIEEILFEHEAVAEAVAVGIPDEYRGETVKAFVVRREGGEVTEEEILAFCRERLAPYKAPKMIEFREELPKSTVGKLLRRVLVDEESSKGGSTAPPSPS